MKNIGYEMFKSQCSLKKVSKITENVLIAYLSKKSKVMKSAILYSILFVLMLKTKNRVKNEYQKLIAFLKQQAVGYKIKNTMGKNPKETAKFFSYLNPPCIQATNFSEHQQLS